MAPLLYCVFLLANSAAAASLGGARAAEVEHDHQGLLNLVVGTLGLAGFLVGVVLWPGCSARSASALVLGAHRSGHDGDGARVPAIAGRRVAGAQLEANSRRPSPMQDSVSVGSASFENGVCQTW